MPANDRMIGSKIINQDTAEYPSLHIRSNTQVQKIIYINLIINTKTTLGTYILIEPITNVLGSPATFWIATNTSPRVAITKYTRDGLHNVRKSLGKVIYYMEI
jgi:hypothetical protein